MFTKQTTTQTYTSALLASVLMGIAITGNAASTTVQARAPQVVEKFWNELSHTWLSQDQIELLNLAHRIGREDQGQEHAALLQAILLQESHAGNIGRIGDTHAPMGKRSYGVMQVKLTTAYDVLASNPELGSFKTDEELLIKLITDDYFNIQIASKHLLGLRSKTRRDNLAILAYNTGLKKAKSYSAPNKHGYVGKIRNYIKFVVRPFNERFGNRSYTVASVE